MTPRPHLSVVPPRIDVGEVQQAWLSMASRDDAPAPAAIRRITLDTEAGALIQLRVDDREAFHAWAEWLGLEWQADLGGSRALLYGARGDTVINDLHVRWEISYVDYRDGGAA